jgi:PHD-finger
MKGGAPQQDAAVLKGSFGTGCLVCKKEDDEDKILLCETCEGEYHTYCLQPKLPAVPEEDWYCGTYDTVYAIASIDSRNCSCAFLIW